MNKNSNTYTFLYATGLVVVVAAALAIAAMSLKDRQQKNIEIEKKQNILASVNKTEGVGKADNKAAYIEELYDKYIIEQYVVGADGNRKDGDAFTIDMEAQYDIIKKINASDVTQE